MFSTRFSDIESLSGPDIRTFMEFGLQRITRLIRDVHPKLPWKAFHIAGTNGKGTTSAFLSGLLHHAGTTVGRFNSPYLIHRHDCITINEKTIDRDLFDSIERDVKKRNDDAGINATSFELLTATAFEAFVRTNMAFGVVECGLGGLRDATNVLNADEVICSIITSIGKDHAEFLGDDVTSIAQQKAGIMKEDVPVVVRAKGPILQVLEEAAAEAGSPIYLDKDARTRRAFLRLVQSHDANLHNDPDPAQRFEVGYGSITRDLTGRFTPDFTTSHLKNLSLAYLAIMAARARHSRLVADISLADAMEVAMKVRSSWLGRMQWISLSEFAGRDSAVLLDGAHNPPATKQLRSYVNEKATVDGAVRPITWVIAMSGSKDIPSTLGPLIGPKDRVIFTQFGPVDGMPWASSASFQLLSNVAKELTRETIKYVPTPGEAIRTAVRITPEEQLIVVAGSLYLVGDVLRIPAIGNSASPLSEHTSQTSFNIRRVVTSDISKIIERVGKSPK